MSVEIFSNIYNGPFKRYILLSESIGQDVQNQSEIVELAFQAELRFLEFLENFKKPDNQSVILDTIVDQISKTVRYICVDPSLTDHVKVIAQSINVLLWIQQKDPVSYLEEMLADAKAYTDVLLVFFKDKEPHVEWVDAWLETLNDLNNFVRRRYPKGLNWNEEETPNSSLQKEHTLSQEISKGESVKKILLRANEESKDIDEPSLSKNTEMYIQEGKKWRIEHKKGVHKQVTIDKANTDNVVYIYDCYNVTVVIEKKINLIKIDSCDKVCVICRSLISGVEIIASKNMKLHAFGTLPSINMDSCNDVNIHLTKRGLDSQVITCQCSKISLSYPLEDGYYKTFYIPNRLMTTINTDHTLKTHCLMDN
ncbi:hypothetical protein HHI36_010878 [Cryptolaemus montrouzieri]|uniref:C-CAP/cofactor C-like domain-containing protein n=1 Tax=Cryptolaemus montrouzieri TaxID=559131 RepID=A0ABD2MK67_9CUCU